MNDINKHIEAVCQRIEQICEEAISTAASKHPAPTEEFLNQLEAVTRVAIVSAVSEFVLGADDGE